MFTKDLKTETSTVAVLNSSALTSTSTSSGVDTQTYTGNMELILNVGTVSGTTPTLDVKVQDSADNSSFADVSGYTFTQVTAANNTQTISVDKRLVRRYIKIAYTIAGTTPSFTTTALLKAYKQTT